MNNNQHENTSAENDELTNSEAYQQMLKFLHMLGQLVIVLSLMCIEWLGMHIHMITNPMMLSSHRTGSSLLHAKPLFI